MTTQHRISLWSGPRNVSTALMYAFAQRADTQVLDEPLYGHYLANTDSPHPMREEIMDHMETRLEVLLSQLTRADYPKPVLFMKNMAHHLLDTPPGWTREFTNVLLVRDPREVIPSLLKVLPQPILRDLGYAFQMQLFQEIKARGEVPIVIDAQQVLLDPPKVLGTLCDRIGIPKDAAMLSWPQGPRPEDGIWAPKWYHNVHRSTGFAAYRPKSETVPEAFLPLLETCNKYYTELHKEAIMA